MYKLYFMIKGFVYLSIDFSDLFISGRQNNQVDDATFSNKKKKNLKEYSNVI